MPVDYSRDDVKRRVRVVLRGTVTVDVLKAIIDRQVIEGAWTYGMLYDLRSLTTLPTADEAEEILDHVRKTAETRGPRGPVAVVARAVGSIGLAQRYAMRAGVSLTLEVFWDIDEAERWLDEPYK